MREGAPGGAFRSPHAAVVGRYSCRPHTDEWRWSDAMFRIHGFEPGEVVPTTELVMRHIHPEDVPAAWESREQVVEKQERRVLGSDATPRLRSCVEEVHQARSAA